LSRHPTKGNWGTTPDLARKKDRKKRGSAKSQQEGVKRNGKRNLKEQTGVASLAPVTLKSKAWVGQKKKEIPYRSSKAAKKKGKKGLKRGTKSKRQGKGSNKQMPHQKATHEVKRGSAVSKSNMVDRVIADGKAIIAPKDAPNFVP